MRALSFAACWAAAAVLTTVTQATGQDVGTKPPDDRPYLFVSPSPDEPADATPAKKPVRKVNLRVNQDQPLFIYVYNPLGEQKTVRVELVAPREVADGVDGGRRKLEPVVARWAGAVGPKKSVRVPLDPDRAQFPPPTPPTTAADKPAAPPAVPLPDASFFRLTGEDKEDKVDITVMGVASYAKAEKAAAPDGWLGISVSLQKLDFPLVGGPVPVRLTARGADGGLIPAAGLGGQKGCVGGTLAVTGGDGSDRVDLRVDPAALGPGGRVEIEVDGAPRVFQYNQVGEPAPAATRVAVPAAWTQGKPVPVRVEVDDAVGDREELHVVLADPGAADGAVRRIRGPRDRGIGFRVGSNGEAVFVTRDADWRVEFPTQGLFGRRDVFVRAGAGKDARKLEGGRSVRFDATPATVQLSVSPVAAAVNPGRTIFRPGERVTVRAVVTDPESGADPTRDAVFYLGDRPGPDGKPAPGGWAKTVKAQSAGTSPDGLPAATYATELDLPAAAGPDGVKVGVLAANAAGLAEPAEFRIDVDPTPPEVSVVGVTPEKGVGGAYRPGDTIRLTATAFDRESKIDLGRPVLFFLGDPPGPDGKPAQGTLVMKAAAGVLPGAVGPEGGPVWAADFALPKDLAKDLDLKIGAWFVNTVGAANVRVGTIRVEPEPKDPAVGTVKVLVVKGGAEVRQAGVPVRLIDQLGRPAAAATTDECGRAVFNKVLPGRYQVLAYKPEDGNSYDVVPVTVTGGSTQEVGLSVRRNGPSPAAPAKAAAGGTGSGNPAGGGASH